MTIATLPVRVLNASYEDLGPTTLDRAMALVEVQGRAEIIMVDETKTIRTMGGREFFLPKIIRLLTFKKVDIYFAPKVWSRDGVIQRDNATCAYCGKPGLTVDHILAQSLGGKDDWMNTVACCHKCNGEKSNLTMEQWGKPVLFEITPERMIPQKMYYRSEFARRRKRKRDR
jgi:hypothetical protein